MLPKNQGQQGFALAADLTNTSGRSASRAMPKARLTYCLQLDCNVCGAGRWREFERKKLISWNLPEVGPKFPEGHTKQAVSLQIWGARSSRSVHPNPLGEISLFSMVLRHFGKIAWYWQAAPKTAEIDGLHPTPPKFSKQTYSIWDIIYDNILNISMLYP